MKTIKLLSMVGIVSMLAVSCDLGNDKPVEPDQPDNPVPPVETPRTPVSVTASVCELSKAGHASGDLTEGSLGLFFESAGTNGDSQFNASNREVRYDGSVWAIQGSELLWKDENTSATYFAYYPYSANIADKQSYSWTVPTTQDASSIKAADFLYALPKTATSKTAEGEIAIAFDHALAKLKIQLSFGSEVSSAAMVNSVVLENCATVGTIDLTSGLCVSTDGVAEITMFNNGCEYECIMIPQSVQYGLTVRLTDNGEERTFRYSAPANQEFAVGTEYILPVKIGGDKVEAGGISSKAWDEEEGGALVTK